MARAHVFIKENLVSSKARPLNQLNKTMAAPGAEVGGQFKQMYKNASRSTPKISSLLFPQNFLSPS